jgi:hypothetical protein
VTPKRPEKKVAGMAVLTDIRGLLSSSRVPSESAKGERVVDETASVDDETVALRTLVAKQEAQIAQLVKERDALLARVATLEVRPVAPPVEARNAGLARGVADMEARRAELENGLAQVEDLLQTKVKELARRIARIYEDAGDYGATRDFRRTTDQLESSENFGEFLRALARD